MKQIIDKQNKEIEELKTEISRRDVTVAELMERETIRNAEIEKLTRMASQRQENDEDLDLDPVASSVLCIKCKKSLDDVSNIREAIIGKSSLQKLACQSYRVLLPNNKGKKPHRSVSWLKACMRSILTAMMVEITALTPIGESVSTFPSFVYAWFEPAIDHSSQDSHSVQACHQKADEDRWGLYYGVKVLAKEDAEAKLFWGLLDQVQGEDGLVFLCHCLSVVLSIGGSDLWTQFGSTMTANSASLVSEFLNTANQQCVCSNIWLDLETAHAAVKLILVRALESQVAETLDAIDSLKEVPDVDGDEISEKTNNEKTVHAENSTPTHIDLFVWLRVLMHRFQDEQCHRQAAIRLMFDTASLGTHSGPNNAHNESGDDSHVYFPQFVAVMNTLYPSIAITEVAELYADCYREGGSRVTASIFAHVSEKRHLFSKSLKLCPLPMFLFEGIRGMKCDSSLGFGASQSLRVRSQIGSLVHSHYTILVKDVSSIAQTLPSKWKSMILDASESVELALKDHFVKMKSRKRHFSGTAPGGASDSTDRQSSAVNKGDQMQEHYVDGLQPFIQYHRLLALLLFVKSFGENTVLPVSFITNNETISANDTVRSLSFKKVENVIASLEHSIFCHSSSAGAAKRYETIEMARRNIILRKIQFVFKNFIAHDAAIPRPIRLVMRPGYLRGANSSGPPLKARRVYLEPWALQTLVAQVYTFKINYDAKAIRNGLAPLNLPLATVSAHLQMFNVPDVAERTIHDLCLGMQVYMHGLPRLRLFASFFGCGEIDEPYAIHLKSDFALTSFFELIFTIHKVLSHPSTDSEIQIIKELFPCSIDPSSRLDKRDLWQLPITTLQTAINEWSKRFIGLKDSMWKFAMDRVPRSSEGMAEVDDFLWVVMQVWAKAMYSHSQKCNEKGRSRCVEEGILPKTLISPNAISENELLDELLFSHEASVGATAKMLNSIHQSQSEVSTNVRTTDISHCSAMYARSVSTSKRCTYVALKNLLESCMVWDTTTTPNMFPQSLEIEKNSGVDIAKNRNRPCEVVGAVPSMLSLRLIQMWWNSNKEGVKTCIDDLEVRGCKNYMRSEITSLFRVAAMIILLILAF